jgi:hypothetical protein
MNLKTTISDDKFNSLSFEKKWCKLTDPRIW